MNLDRREEHVLSELWAQYNIPTKKLRGKIVAKEVAVFYTVDGDKIRCGIIDNFDYVDYGLANRSPKDSNRYPVGRMIAFARAILRRLNKTKKVEHSFSLTGEQLENIARGNTLYEEERRKCLNLTDTMAQKQLFVSNKKLTSQYETEKETKMNPQTKKAFVAAHKDDVRVISLGNRHYEYVCKIHPLVTFTNQAAVVRHLRNHRPSR